MSRVPKRPYKCPFIIECTSEEDYDDDVLFGDGLQEMTEEESRRYYEQVAESDGFDVDPLPGVFALSIIVPVDLDCNPGLLLDLINLAIEHHNKTNSGKKLRLKEPVKWNVQAMCPMDYYITFTAEDEETHEVETYQTKVVGRIPVEKRYVDMFRVKPKKSASGL